MRKRMWTTTLLVALLAGAVSTDAGAQLCASTAPLAEYTDLTGAPLALLEESPDASRITAGRGSTAYFVETSLADFYGAVSLTDDADAMAYEHVLGSYTSAWIFVSQSNGYIEGIDTSPTVVWRRNLSRSGCANDRLYAAPVHHPRATSTPAFQGAYANDLVYAGTFYDYDGSGGCSGDYRTDNRVYALDATNGTVKWVFNVSGTVDVDKVFGMTLDAANDRLYFTTERLFSSTQHSVWALDVLTGTVAWSINAGRVQMPPTLHGGRLYVVTATGEFKALDPATGSEHWSLQISLLPITAPMQLTVTDVAGQGTVLALADFTGQIQVVRDDGASGTQLQWFSLPIGTAGSTMLPTIKAVSRVAMDATGKGLVGADDGKVYPLDLVNGTVGTPVAVDVASASVDHLVLEPPGVVANPASFLVGTSEGLIARYCTTLGTTPVPALGPAGRVGLALALSLLSAAVWQRPRTQR